MLEKTLKIDCELDLAAVNMDLYNSLARFAPFGIGNPEPVFTSEVRIESIRTVGQENKHLKLTIFSPQKASPSEAIAFNQGSLVSKLKIGDRIKIAYSLDLNTFNGSSKLQFKIKDIRHGGIDQSHQKL